MEELPKSDKEFIEELILKCPEGKELISIDTLIHQNINIRNHKNTNYL